MNELSCVILDPCSPKDERVKAKVKSFGQGIGISFNGYGRESEEILIVEKYDGELRIMIWADKDEECATHTISLEGAKRK